MKKQLQVVGTRALLWLFLWFPGSNQKQHPSMSCCAAVCENFGRIPLEEPTGFKFRNAQTVHSQRLSVFSGLTPISHPLFPFFKDESPHGPFPTPDWVTSYSTSPPPPPLPRRICPLPPQLAPPPPPHLTPSPPTPRSTFSPRSRRPRAGLPALGAGAAARGAGAALRAGAARPGRSWRGNERARRCRTWEVEGCLNPKKPEKKSRASILYSHQPCFFFSKSDCSFPELVFDGLLKRRIPEKNGEASLEKWLSSLLASVFSMEGSPFLFASFLLNTNHWDLGVYHKRNNNTQTQFSSLVPTKAVSVAHLGGCPSEFSKLDGLPKATTAPFGCNGWEPR